MSDIFTKRLVELMEEKDISQVELSRLVGTTNVTISRYINDKRKPRIEIVAKIANVLGTSIDYLLGYSNEKNFSNYKVNKKYSSLYSELDKIHRTISKKQLSNEQILIIEKLLESNNNFISNIDEKEKNA